MSTSVELMRYLAMQQACLQELYNLLKDEEQAIITVDTDRMNALNLLKESVNNRQRSIMLEGKEVLAAIARKAGLPQNATISQVIEKMEPRQQAELNVLHNGMTELAAKVKYTANNNRGMLERFLATVNDSLAFILRILNSSNIYGSSGVYLNHGRTSAMMVNREA